MAQEDFGLQLYHSITKVTTSNPTKLSLLIKKNVIEVIIKLTIGYEINEDILAKKIIEDLDTLKDKRDIEFVNNILTPLLKAENKVPVSFDFFDESSNTYYTFKNAIEQCSESPKSNNFLAKPEFTNVARHLQKVVGKKYNAHKILFSDWKLLFNFPDKTVENAYEKLLKALENKTSVFITFEGFCKKLNENVTFGVYNRNAVYNKNDEYFIKTSDDNFVFAVIGKNEYCSFTSKPDSNILQFETNEKEKLINIASSFVKIDLPQEKQTYTQFTVNKELHQDIQMSKGFTSITDFKLDCINVYELYGMQEDKVDVNAQAA
jgi:hypothetical protein